MKKICFFTFFLAGLWLSSYAQIVPVGSGSYTTAFPGTDEAGRNTFPSGTPQLSGVAATKAVPTNDWWSNFVKVDHGGQAFNYPLSFRSVTDGLVVNYTIPQSASATEYRQPMSDVKSIVVGLDGLNAARSTVANHTDWTVSMNWASSGRSFNATMGMGMPFVYFTKNSADIAKVNVGFNPAGASVSGNKIIIRGSMSNSSFVVFGPAGTTWSGSGGVFTSSLGGKTYWSMAMVPPGMDVNTFISSYERFAHVHPADTRVSWNYNESTAVVRSTFTVTPDVKEGSANTVLLGLLPHQWAHLAANSPQPNLATYKTVRGELRMLASNTFAVENKFSGVLPTLPDLGKYSSGFDIAALNTKVNSIKGDGLPGWTDSYNEGQNMNRLIQAARIADQIGNIAARDQMLATVQERLEDWLQAEGGEKAFLFYYNSDWDALLGYPAGHSQDSNLNDHHFHWGYFIHAASALEQFKPGWAAQWGPMINVLIRDAANPSRNDSMFPFLRNFSPYAGHAWANGFATEPFGNDQESTSESMQFNAALIHWGTITNNTAIRDLGIYLYTTEVTAVQEYWFDINRRTIQPEYAHEMVARIWSAGYDNGTWWTSDIAASYGIQLYPIHGGALYMGYNTDYVRRVWEGMKAKTGVLNNTPNANLWYDTYWSYLSFLDPAEALRLYNSYPDRDVKIGISDAQTYHWLHTMNAMGQVASEITADYPIAAVFIKNGVKTYVAHNYGSSDRTIRFSDGASLFAPAGKMVTNRDAGIAVSLTAPGVVEEPCAAGVNSNFTLQANASGSVSRVEFFRNGTLIATDNTAPYTLAQSFTSDGVHTYLAKAYNGTNFANSNVLQVVVGHGTQTPYTTALVVPGSFQSGHYDKGGQGISYFDTDPNVYEANFRPDDEVDAATSTSQGTSIGWIAPGEWLEYTINATAGKYAIDFSISSNQAEGGSSGSISAFLDCNPVGTVNATPTTGSWDTYQAARISDVSVTAGTHILRVRFNSGVYNLGRITFTRTGDLGNNQAPSASITSPAAGAVFSAGQAISISANASDPDGTVSKVEFFANGIIIGEDTTVPFTYSWTDAAAGTHTLTARATDNGGFTSALSPGISVRVDQAAQGSPIPGRIQAESYAAMNGIQTETTTDTGGGLNVGWIDAGDWMDYAVSVASAGTYKLDFRVASAAGGGQLQLRSGSSTLATLAVPNTGGWQSWTTATVNVSLAAGAQTLRVYAGAGGWNFNWMEFSSSAPSGTDITDLGGTISAQWTDSPANEGFTNLIDNSASTKYLTFNNSGWVQFQAQASYILSSYSITSANDAPERDPLNWTLQGSNNGSTWTTLDSRSGEDFPSRFQKRSFNFSNSAAFSYYRLNLTNNSGNMLQLAEIELFGTAACTPTAITPNLSINGGAWQQTSTATLSAGGTIVLGPQAATGGSWSWTGPGGFSASTREISRSNIQSSQAGNYLVSYTNSAGCSSTHTFTVNVTTAPAGFAIPGTIEAESYSAMNGVQTETTTDTGGGLNVGWIDAGDWMDYPVSVASAGSYTLEFRVASANGGGQLQLRSGTSTLASVNIAATGGWQSWTTVTTTATLAAGNQTLRLYAPAGGFNLNWVRFTSGSGGGSGSACTFTASTGDYTASVSADASNPTITFVPSRTGVGASTLILYYGTSATGPIAGYTVAANTPYRINAAAGQTIYFYYTYSVPEGGERNTSTSRHSFSVGNCSAGARMAQSLEQADVESQGLDLYPNPVTQTLHILQAGDLRGAGVHILDASGRMVYAGVLTSGKLDVSNLPAGLYLLRITNQEQILQKRFIKQ